MAKQAAWQPSGSVAANARLLLPALAREYFATGREVVREGTGRADLHPFRLATKRFRYTLEAFREFYGPSLDRRLRLLKPVQDALGEVNDCVATRREFGGDKEFRRYLARRADRKAKAFYRTWKNEFDVPGQEASWVRYLARVTERCKLST